jgi:hypothetical protein
MADITYVANIALAEVPVNTMPLIDDTDFKSREVAIVYNQAGMDLVWNFIDALGAFTQTAVTPTTSGTYDWTHQGDGMYTIEIPKSGGASINNNTVGVGWFTGICTGVLAWAGPRIEFVLGGEITSGTPSTTAFICAELTTANTDQFKDAYVTFISGTCAGATKKITAFTPGSDTITCDALPATPSVGDKFYIVNGA